MSSTPSFQLTTDERDTLEEWTRATASDRARAHHGPTKRALRAAIVLAAADGIKTQLIAERIHVRPSTVDKWLDRFVQERIAGLDDRPRSGAPRRIDQERIADVLRRTSEKTPPAARSWSRRTMARATGLSRSTVHRIWNTFDIAPERRTPAQ